MHKLWKFSKAVGQHWWFLMATVTLAILGLVPAITAHTIPRWVYWLAALVCMAIAFYKVWNEHYDIAVSYKREADDVYADVILDWLKGSCPTPAFFPAQFLADKLKWDIDKVLRGLTILEKELKVVKNDGHAGWSYNPAAAFRFQCNLRKLITS
jgi:hypothetical protein